MSWRDAPLYTEVRALAADTVERAARWHHPWAEIACTRAATLVESVTLSLTFVRGRERHLEAADHANVALREALRIAGDLHLLPPGALREAERRSLRAGRMIGGWRQRLARGPPVDSLDDDEGGGAPPATTG